MRAFLSFCRCSLFLSIAVVLSPLVTGTAQGQEANNSANPAANIPVQATGTPASEATDSSLDIDYTGSLMGFYRMEYGEDAGTAALPPVKSFLEFRQEVRQKDSSRLLLGMGDNFGPEFGAALQLVGKQGSPCYAEPKETESGEQMPESLYKDDDRIPTEAPCDNVLNFMMHAGFRAVVPGTQDFMYTARWLRESALLVYKVSHADPNKPAASDVIAKADQCRSEKWNQADTELKECQGKNAGSDDCTTAKHNCREALREADAPDEHQLVNNSENQIYMLGANLRISLKDDSGGAQGHAGGGSGGGKVPCPLLFNHNSSDQDSIRCEGDGGEPEPFDWLNRLDRLSRSSDQDNNPNPTVTALRDLATESAEHPNARQVELDELIRDENSILQAAWGSRFRGLPTWPVQSRKQNPQAENQPETATQNTTAVSRPQGKTQPSQAGNQPMTPQQASDLSVKAKDVAGKLNTLPECNAPSSDDQKDMCDYARRLSGIMDTYSKILDRRAQRVAHTTGVPAPPRNQVNGADLVLTTADRLAAIRGLLRTIAKEESDVGFTIAHLGAERPDKNVLIVGVVGQETMQAVSETNLDLCLVTPTRPRGAQQMPAPSKQSDSSQDFNTCGNRTQLGKFTSVAGKVTVTDPVEATQAVVRGAALMCAEDSDCKKLQRVVVMAQMSHTEAEILAQRVAAQLKQARDNQTGAVVPRVDVVVSEAESGYGTPNQTLTYHQAAKNATHQDAAADAAHQDAANAPTQPEYPSTVATPLMTYSSQPARFPGAVSMLTLATGSDNSFTLTNQRDPAQRDPGSRVPAVQGKDTTISLLYNLVQYLQNQDPSAQQCPASAKDIDAFSHAPIGLATDLESRQKAEFALLRDLQKAAAQRLGSKLRRIPAPDVVLLQSRDVELDTIDGAYSDYSMCTGQKGANTCQLCELRSALDRIFWKGDYLEYVAVTGKNLEDMIKKSEDTMAQQAQLADTGPSGQWLISYGIVQSSLTNLTQISQNDEPLWIPVDPHCVGQPGQPGKQTTYCIDGTPVTDDAYYWLITTDQLAQDKTIYGTLQGLPNDTHTVTERFVSNPLSHFLQRNLNNPNTGGSPNPSLALRLLDDTKKAMAAGQLKTNAPARPSAQQPGQPATQASAQPSANPPVEQAANVPAQPSAPQPVAASAQAPARQNANAQTQPETQLAVEGMITADNETFQQRELIQVDFAKVIASFSSREAVGGNTFVSLFQGVSDARASVPNQQSLDLEMASRVLYQVAGSPTSKFWPPPFAIGEQGAFSYDRAVIGNLTGKPINATYPLNNLTEGAFLQVRFGGAKDNVRSVQTLPRSLLVLTPHQYQLQIDTPYLFIPFSNGQVPSGEITVQLPRIDAWTDRAGFREEFAHSRPKGFASYLPTAGSYLETGMEFSIQNSNLSALTLQTVTSSGTKQKTCPVYAKVTLQTCFGSASYGSPAIVLTLNNTTTVVGNPAIQSLHSPGYYWDLHFQDHIYGKEQKQVSLVTDAQGDYYFGRPVTAELPTQTNYAIPLNVSLVLPSLGNLTFAPTYSAFFFRPQLSPNSLMVNTFSIAARWYFARDARVPVPKQAPLQGPQSSNQTVTGKSH